MLLLQPLELELALKYLENTLELSQKKNLLKRCEKFHVSVFKFIFLFPQIDLIERRSRRDMSPQGRKRVAGMVSRDYQTVSGVGGTQSYQHQVRIRLKVALEDNTLFLVSATTKR